MYLNRWPNLTHTEGANIDVRDLSRILTVVTYGPPLTVDSFARAVDNLTK